MKVLLAEDQEIVRTGISSFLRSTGFIKKIEEAKDGRDAIEKAKVFEPDLFVLDYEMPEYNGTYAARIIKAKWPEIPVLIISMDNSEACIMDAVGATVQGIVFKGATKDEFIDAIRTVASGGLWFKGQIAEVIANKLLPNHNGSQNGVKTKQTRTENSLTKRENELITYFVNGLSCPEIARTFFISKRTVESHKANIFKKLGVNNTAKLIKYAIDNNLV